MKLKQLLIILLITAAVGMNTFSAFAYNEDYLAKEKWVSSDKVTTEHIYVYSPDSEIEGSFSYYADSESLCLYTAFTLEGTNISPENESVCVIYVFKTEKEEYTLEVDKNGLIEELHPEEAKVFDCGAEFDYSSSTYISAVEYKGRDKLAYVNVSFYDGVSRYVIREDIELDRRPEETTKAEKTSKGKDKTTTKKSKQKSQTTKNSASKSRSGGSEGETKFEPSGDYIPDEKSAQEYGVENAEAAVSSAVKRLPFASGITVIIAVLLALTGFALIIVSAFLKEKNKTDNNNESTTD